MGSDVSRRRRGDFAFSERFGDLFSEKIGFAIALGLMLTWVWMSLVEGYPVFMDGTIDTASVALVLLSCAASLFAFGFLRPLDAVLSKPGVWMTAAVLICAADFVLLCVYCDMVSLDVFARTALTRCLMAVVGLCTGVMVQCCAVAFSTLRPASAAVGFFIACSVMFVVYFSLNVCKGVGGPMVEGSLFCVLPPAAAGLLLRSRKTILERLALWPDSPCAFASGFRWMCASFAMFFFAMGAKSSLEPSHEFGVASDMSVVGIFVVATVFLYLVAIRPHPIGVFKLLKGTCSASVLVLAVCIALQRLSLDPALSIVFNTDCVLLIMVLWLLACFVAYSNEAYVCKVVAFALGFAALGMALGWVSGKAVYAAFGHDRVYFSIGLACATAAFSTWGFSSKNFPFLIAHGEAAKKMRRTKEAVSVLDVDYDRLLADEAGMTDREFEVFKLLVEGHNATSVADELVISYHTSRTHVRNIYRKLDVHSYAELVAKCAQFREDYGANADTNG